MEGDDFQGDEGECLRSKCVRLTWIRDGTIRRSDRGSAGFPSVGGMDIKTDIINYSFTEFRVE